MAYTFVYVIFFSYLCALKRYIMENAPYNKPHTRHIDFLYGC